MKKFILILLVSFLISCSKETVKTPGQVTADQINSALSGTNITHAWIYEWNGTYFSSSFSYGANITFLIKGQFVIVTVSYTGGSFNSYYYNLEKLSKFDIATGGYLELYFN
jgi:hypothetical protein